MVCSRIGWLWIALALTVMAAEHGVAAQLAQAHLRHVASADVDGDEVRRVCFSARQQGLHVLVVEVNDREQFAYGFVVPAIEFSQSATPEEGLSAIVDRGGKLVIINANDSDGWGWMPVEIGPHGDPAGCYRVGVGNARLRLYSQTVSRR